MRGRISDQDLTDYALNELQPEERLYVESILAISEECRNDVYEMIEVGQLLEEGFEVQDEEPAVLLTGQQHSELLQFRRTMPAWQKVAAVLALSAGTAFTIAHPGFWRVEDAGGKVAHVSTQMSKMVVEAIHSEGVDLSGPIANMRVFSEESPGWLPVASEVIEQTVCTPPSTWFETAQLQPSVR